jgi:hypothetical protein
MATSYKAERGLRKSSHEEGYKKRTKNPPDPVGRGGFQSDFEAIGIERWLRNRGRQKT